VEELVAMVVLAEPEEVVALGPAGTLVELPELEVRAEQEGLCLLAVSLVKVMEIFQLHIVVEELSRLLWDRVAVLAVQEVVAVQEEQGEGMVLAVRVVQEALLVLFMPVVLLETFQPPTFFLILFIRPIMWRLLEVLRELVALVLMDRSERLRERAELVAQLPPHILADSLVRWPAPVFL